MTDIVKTLVQQIPALVLFVYFVLVIFKIFEKKDETFVAHLHQTQILDNEMRKLQTDAIQELSHAIRDLKAEVRSHDTRT